MPNTAVKILGDRGGVVADRYDYWAIQPGPQEIKIDAANRNRHKFRPAPFEELISTPEKMLVSE